MNYDNEAIVRNAYHTAEGKVLDIPGWIGNFTEDGVFNNVTGEESYRGEHLKDVVIAFGQMFPDIHRELHRVNVTGDVGSVGIIHGLADSPIRDIQFDNCEITAQKGFRLEHTRNVDLSGLKLTVKEGEPITKTDVR